MFAALCLAQGLPEPVPEFEFAKEAGRKWKFDWAWPSKAIALEIEGGIWRGGRHNRPIGFLKDMEKYNAAALLGWRVFRCTTDEFNSGDVFGLLNKALRT